VQGSINLITKALAAVGCKMELLPDPTTVHYHLPSGLSVRVHRKFEDFLVELTGFFPHEREGISQFYNECWKVSFAFAILTSNFLYKNWLYLNSELQFCHIW